MARFCLIAVALLTLLPAPVGAQTVDDEPTCTDFAPDDADATFFVGLGAAASAEGDFTRAIFVYTCALERDPAYAPAYVSRGLAHASQFNFPLALQDYNTALELDGELVEAYNNRGILYTQQANYGLAIADFTVVTVIVGDFAPAYHNRGLVHAIEGNYDLAIDDLQRAIELDPDYAAPHTALGAVYLALATESYENYRRITGRPAIPDADDTLDALQSRLETGDATALQLLQTPSL